MDDNYISCWRCGAEIKEQHSYMLELSCFDHKGRLHPMFPPEPGEMAMDTARVRLPVCKSCMKKLSHGFFACDESEYVGDDSTEDVGCLVPDISALTDGKYDSVCGRDCATCEKARGPAPDDNSFKQH